MYIRAFVTAGVRRDRIERSTDGTYAISVRAPARGNEANTRVRELLAREFETEMRNVRIFSGHRSRSKMIVIDT